MKILIPASGGVNSTYALWRWLDQTDHEIIASFAEETWTEPSRRSREREEAGEMVEWLKANVRDFTYETIQWPVAYQAEQAPVRVGFIGTMDVGVVKPRYHGYKALIDAHSPDGIVIGMSLENTAVDTYPIFRSIFETTGVDIYLAGVPELMPVARGEALDYDSVSTKMMGRHEQFEALPAALQALTEKCDTDTCTDVWCRTCAYKRGYEKFKADGKTARDFDLYCAKKGSYGPYRSEADPAEYRYRGGCCDECALDNYLADAAGREWPIEIDARKRIAWFAENGVDMSGIEKEQQLGDFCGRMGRINLDRGVDSDGMRGDEYWAAILAASKEA